MGFAEDWAAANAGSTRKVGETGYTGVGMSTPDGQPNASFGYMPWVIGGGSNSAPVYNSPGQPTGAPFRSVGAPSAFDNSPKYNDQGERLSIQGQQSYTGYGNAGGGTLFQPTVVGTTAQPRLADLPMETGYTGVGMSTPDGRPNASFGYMPWGIGGGSNSAPVYNSPGQPSGTPFRSSGAEFAPPAQAASAPMPVQPMPQATPAVINEGTANSRQAVVNALAGMAPQGQEARGLPTKHFPRYNFSGGYSRGPSSGGGGSSLDPNMRHFLGWGGGVA